MKIEVDLDKIVQPYREIIDEDGNVNVNGIDLLMHLAKEVDREVRGAIKKEAFDLANSI